MVGASEGLRLGLWEIDGAKEGTADGRVLGETDGKLEGVELGKELGCNDGEADGSFEGVLLGHSDGWLEGAKLGSKDGSPLGVAEGIAEGPLDTLGLELGAEEGVAVPRCATIQKRLFLMSSPELEMSRIVPSSCRNRSFDTSV